MKTQHEENLNNVKPLQNLKVEKPLPKFDRLSLRQTAITFALFLDRYKRDFGDRQRYWVGDQLYTVTEMYDLFITSNIEP